MTMMIELAFVHLWVRHNCRWLVFGYDPGIVVTMGLN